jgi:predicted nucleic acid-binding protein
VIAYFDTSALVPLLISEPTSVACGQLWTDAERVVSVPILYTEARAALARAERSRRLTRADHNLAIHQLDLIFDDIFLVDVSVDLVRLGGHLAQRHGLRGFDAVHLAGGVLSGVDDPSDATANANDEFVFATGDKNLASAAREAGLAVANLSR